MLENINIPIEQIRDFCQRWKIVELALFGSVLRDDFHSESDIDVLVSFSPHEQWDLLHFIRIEIELGELLGRKVDLVEEVCLRNPFRRRRILHTKEVIYAA